MCIVEIRTISDSCDITDSQKTIVGNPNEIMYWTILVTNSFGIRFLSSVYSPRYDNDRISLIVCHSHYV